MSVIWSSKKFLLKTIYNFTIRNTKKECSRLTMSVFRRFRSTSVMWFNNGSGGSNSSSSKGLFWVFFTLYVLSVTKWIHETNLGSLPASTSPLSDSTVSTSLLGPSKFHRINSRSRQINELAKRRSWRFIMEHHDGGANSETSPDDKKPADISNRDRADMISKKNRREENSAAEQSLSSNSNSISEDISVHNCPLQVSLCVPAQRRDVLRGYLMALAKTIMEQTILPSELIIYLSDVDETVCKLAQKQVRHYTEDTLDSSNDFSTNRISPATDHPCLGGNRNSVPTTILCKRAPYNQGHARNVMLQHVRWRGDCEKCDEIESKTKLTRDELEKKIQHVRNNEYNSSVIISFVDADDGLHPVRTEFLLRAFIEYPELKMLGHRRSKEPRTREAEINEQKRGFFNLTFAKPLFKRLKETKWAMGRGGICAYGHVSVRKSVFENFLYDEKPDKHKRQNLEDLRFIHRGLEYYAQQFGIEYEPESRPPAAEAAAETASSEDGRSKGFNSNMALYESQYNQTFVFAWNELTWGLQAKVREERMQDIDKIKVEEIVMPWEVGQK